MPVLAVPLPTTTISGTWPGSPSKSANSQSALWQENSIPAGWRRRDPVTIDLVKDWHQLMLDGVHLGEPEVAGGFRGSGPREGRLKSHRVTVDGILQAVPPGQIRSRMSIFERRLREKTTALDPFIPAKAPPEQRAGKRPTQHREERTVGGLKLGSLHLAAQHLELVAQDGNLDVLGVLAVEASQQHADEPARHEIEEGQGHQQIIA